MATSADCFSLVQQILYQSYQLLQLSKMTSLFAKDKAYIPTWKPPVNVSPLTRLSRWAALLFGVYYGHTRLNYLKEPARCQREDFLARQVGW